jgi:hypothetical protein
VIAIDLPWLTEQFGRPAVALVEPPFGVARDDDVLPPGAQVFEIQCPPARLMADVPALDGEERSKHIVTWERWLDRFLVQAIKRPTMCEADVQMLGPDRDVLAMALLRLWNWVPEDDGSLPNMPSEPFQDILRFLHAKTRRLPSELVEGSFDAFVFNYRVLIGKVKLADAMAAHEAMLDPSMIEGATDA